MAKKNNYPPAILFIAASLLLTGGWLMASFPVFIFFAFAPLLALTDRTDTSTVWEKMEWVLLALTISFLSAHAFDFSFIVSSMLYAILFTLPFVGHVWVRQNLGKGAGKITIVLFWLAIEYTLVNVRSAESIFLADSLRLQPDWTRWNIHTGYLGASLWILMTNLMVYLTFLSENPFRWYWIILTVTFLAGPLTYSYFLNFASVDHDSMVNLYTDRSMIKDVTYLARGELVVRTAAWFSTLILLFSFIKSQTTRR